MQRHPSDRQSATSSTVRCSNLMNCSTARCIASCNYVVEVAVCHSCSSHKTIFLHFPNHKCPRRAVTEPVILYYAPRSSLLRTATTNTRRCVDTVEHLRNVVSAMCRSTYAKTVDPFSFSRRSIRFTASSRINFPRQRRNAVRAIAVDHAASRRFTHTTFDQDRVSKASTQHPDSRQLLPPVHNK